MLDADEEVRVRLGDAVVAAPRRGGVGRQTRAAVGGHAVAVPELVRRCVRGRCAPEFVPGRELAVDAVAGGRRRGVQRGAHLLLRSLEALVNPPHGRLGSST